MQRTEKDIVYAEECYKIIGCVYEIFNKLGYGHKEQFYEKAIAQEFKNRGIDFHEQLPVKLQVKGKEVGVYRLDFLVFAKIIVELKVRNYFSKQDIDQLYAYLKATGLKLGLMVHLTRAGVRVKRVVNLN